MPMIKFEYDQTVYSFGQMRRLADGLEYVLRQAIVAARPSAAHKKYRITIQGRTYGLFKRNTPDLNVRINYHQEWNFTDDELSRIAEEMKNAIRQMLQDAGATINNVKIRLYALVGHKSASLP